MRIQITSNSLNHTNDMWSIIIQHGWRFLVESGGGGPVPMRVSARTDRLRCVRCAPWCCRSAIIQLLFFFSRHSFSYARVKIIACATGAMVHCTQVYTRENRPCMPAEKYRKCCHNKEVIGPYFQDQHIRKEGKIIDRLVEGRSPTTVN